MQFHRPVVQGLTGVLTLLTLTSFLFAQKPTPPPTAEIEWISSDDIERAVQDGTPCRLELLGEVMILQLEAAQLRAGGFRARRGLDGTGLQETEARAPRTFKGHVVGQPESIVRLSTSGGRVRGFIRTDAGWTFIEPDVSSATLLSPDGVNASLVYTEVEVDSGFDGGCVAVLPPTTSTFGQSSSGAVGLPEIAAAETLLELEVAVEADFEFFESHGEDSLGEIESILNEVDGIYQAELGIRIEIVSSTIWETDDDPFTSDVGSTLLTELRDHWTLENGAVVRDIVHLFTGRNLSGSTVGIAYLGVVCSNSFGFGLTQDLSSAALMPLVVAHEIGHNLGAGHDATGTTERYIMYPSLSSQTLDEFSTVSEGSVSDYLDGVSCLAALDDSGDDSGGIQNPSTGNDPIPGGGGSSGGGPVDPLVLILVLFGMHFSRQARSPRAGVER